MKLAIVTLLTVLVAVASAQDTAVGRLVGIQSRTTVSCAATDVGLKCDSCSTALVCQGATPLGKITCESPKTFCDASANQCTSTKPTTCDSGFVCNSEGFFPDPKNCDVYYFCTSTLAAEQYQCPTGYVWDPVNYNCKRKVVAADCVTMKCTTPQVYIVNSKNPKFYAFCDANLVATVYGCPNGLSFVKDTFGCAFVCKAEGYYLGATPDEYYMCTKSGTKLVAEKYNCPTDYVFNLTLKYCTKKTTT